MIEGFEDETCDLTTYELEVVLPKVQRGLLSKRGKDNSVTNKEIVSGLLRNCGIKTNEARVRKVINYIRNRGLIPCLIATSTGYYLPSEKTEIVKYIDSLICREEAIRQVRESMQEQLRHYCA